jgi:hypothetical protein
MRRPTVKYTNVDNIREILKHIESIKSDYEEAHALEDRLLVATLKAIANHAAYPHLLAREALKSLEIDFERHCA